jgi:predicted acyltransferase
MAINDTQQKATLVAELPASLPHRGTRLESLDALRGFDMFWIVGGATIFHSLHDIFKHPATEWINNQLTHVEWEGFLPWDLIMPLFLFIVGVAMPFSFAKRLPAHGDSKTKLYHHILVRTAILFVLGMAAQGRLLTYDLSKLHIYCNTLQAIAAGYLITAVVLLNLRLVWQVVVWVALLLAFWALMVLVPVPGYGAGVLSPDGNLAMYIDKLILGKFQDGTSYTWILSSITFGATVLMGAFAGRWLRTNYSGFLKAMGLLTAAAVCLVVGQVWAMPFPIIKHLWTSSFVLYSGGLSLALLGLFYLIIDVWGVRKWAFGFKVIGLNAIAVYMAAMLFDFRQISNIFITGLDGYLGPWKDFVHVSAGFAALWLILWWMYRKKTFIKI